MGGIKTKIDIEQLRKEIRRFKNQPHPRNRLFYALKEELNPLGWWKNRKRGKPNYGWKRK